MERSPYYLRMICILFLKNYSSFKINSDIEITLESNPDDLSYAKIEQLKKPNK